MSDKPRTLPHRPEAEAAVIGGILLRGVEALAEALEVLGPEDLYLPRSSATFRAMRICAGRGEPLDVVTLEAQLRRTGELELVGGIEGIARFDRFATAHNIRAHAELVRGAAIARRLVVFHREQAERLLEGDPGDLTATVAHAQREHAELASQAHRGDRRLSTMADALLAGIGDVVERANAEPRQGVRFGFRGPDNAIGALLPTEQWLLGARTGHGKSAMAWAIARAQVLDPIPGERGKWVRRWDAGSVFFCSNEMNPASLALRALSEQALINGVAFRSPSAKWLDAYRPQMDAGARMLATAPITFAHTPKYLIDDAIADFRLWHRREVSEGRRPVLGIFDYLQNFKVTGALARCPRLEQIAYISSELLAIALELKIPILSLLQLNRGPETRPGGEPDISDLRESGAPEMDASGIGLMWRPERYHPDRAARKLKLAAYDKRIATPGSGRMTDAEHDEYNEIYRASLLARIKFPKIRGAEPDWAYDLEFMGEYTRVLDPKRNTDDDDQ